MSWSQTSVLHITHENYSMLPSPIMLKLKDGGVRKKLLYWRIMPYKLAEVE